MTVSILLHLISKEPLTFDGIETAHRSATILCGTKKSESYLEDGELLKQLSTILLHLEEARVCEALYKELPFKWRKVYDTVHPFGDKRGAIFQAAWILDTGSDEIIFSNKHGLKMAALTLLRERSVIFDDFQSIAPTYSTPSDKVNIPGLSLWSPNLRVSERSRVFSLRLLVDFQHTWRHILRHKWNDMTSRVLARAILSLASADFKVVEYSGHRTPGCPVQFVGLNDLPGWDPYPKNIVRLRGNYLVIAPTLRDGVSMARDQLKSQTCTSSSLDAPKLQDQLTDSKYVILTIRHIMLGRKSSTGQLEFTQAEHFFKGITQPSQKAIDMLLWAITEPQPRTLLHLLPLEVQDMILRQVSIGPIEAARMACSLSLGSVFAWKDKAGPILLRDHGTKHFPWNPVDSQICIGRSTTGLVYRGQIALKSNIPPPPP